jgi:hypothetical protein
MEISPDWMEIIKIGIHKVECYLDYSSITPILLELSIELREIKVLNLQTAKSQI